MQPGRRTLRPTRRRHRARGSPLASSSTPWRPRVGPRTTGLALAVVLLWLAGSVAAVAQGPEQPDWAASLGIDAVAGIGGQDVPAAWRPVTVTLAPDAPLRGRVLVASRHPGGAVLQSRAVEVGAGAEKRYHLLVPPESDVQVQVVEDGTDRVATVVPRRDVVDGVLVGVLDPLAPADVPATTLPVTDQRATVVGVDPGLLELGPRALQSLGTLVVRQADLVALPATPRDAVARYVADGGALVVVGANDPDLGLPWRPFTGGSGAGLVAAPGAWGADTDTIIGDTVPGGSDPDLVAVAAGRGRVVATLHDVGTAPLAAPAVWEHLVQPRPEASGAARRAAEQLPNLVEQAFGRVVGEPPSVGWLAAFFLAYVLVAGPVVGVVLSRRRRPEVAWVVLPVVTALFVGGAFVGASGARPRVGASAAVDTWTDGLGTTRAVSGVRAPQAGQRAVVLAGTGWAVQGATWDGSLRVDEADDTTVTLAQPGQSFGAVLAQRPLAAPPPLDVEVALFADEARVEVTNTSDEALDRVTLRLGTTTHHLAGRLPAGETLVETVAVPPTLPAQVDPFDAGFGGPFDLEPGPEALAGLLRWGVLDGAPGTVWVTATAPVSDLVVSVDGSPPVDHGRLVAVGSTPSLTDDATLALEVQRDVVDAGGTEVSAEAPLTLSGVGTATLRFRLPAEGTVSALELSLERGCCPDALGPAPDAAQDQQCGRLEVRDATSGDVVEVRDACDPAPPCPPDATACVWDEQASGPQVEGEACFDDGVCHPMTWFPPVAAAVPVDGVPGMQLWDHTDRRWVDHAEVVGGDGTAEPRRWIGPLGDLWVRATGELGPFDVAPQSVAAVLEGRP